MRMFCRSLHPSPKRSEVTHSAWYYNYETGDFLANNVLIGIRTKHRDYFNKSMAIL